MNRDTFQTEAVRKARLAYASTALNPSGEAQFRKLAKLSKPPASKSTRAADWKILRLSIIAKRGARCEDCGKPPKSINDLHLKEHDGEHRLRCTTCRDFATTAAPAVRKIPPRGMPSRLADEPIRQRVKNSKWRRQHLIKRGHRKPLK